MFFLPVAGVHYNSVVLTPRPPPPFLPLSQVKHVKHTGNISLDDCIEIARIMRPRSMARELKGTVKEILGTAKSTGCTVEGEDPQDVQQSIEDGDIEIPDK